MINMMARFNIPASWPCDLHEFSLVALESAEGIDVLRFQFDYFGELQLAIRNPVWNDPAGKARLVELVSMGEKIDIDVLSFSETNGGFELIANVSDFSCRPVCSETCVWEFEGELIEQTFREVGT